MPGTGLAPRAAALSRGQLDSHVACFCPAVGGRRSDRKGTHWGEAPAGFEVTDPGTRGDQGQLIPWDTGAS